MFCENCGNKNKEGHKFCTKCGAKQIKEEINNNRDLNEGLVIKGPTKKGDRASFVILGVSILVMAIIMVYPKIQNYFKNTQEINNSLIANQQEKEDDLTKIHEEELRRKSEQENESLKKEIESLKNKSDNQAKNQKSTDTKLAELREDLKSSKVGQNNYSEQSNTVISAVAKVYCD